MHFTMNTNITTVLVLFSRVNPVHSLQIEVTGVDGPLKAAAEQVLTMKPNFSYTLQEVSDDCAHIFELGWFAKCHPKAEDTRDGIKLTIQVRTFGLTTYEQHSSPATILFLICGSRNRKLSMVDAKAQTTKLGFISFAESNV